MSLCPPSPFADALLLNFLLSGALRHPRPAPLGRPALWAPSLSFLPVLTPSSDCGPSPRADVRQEGESCSGPTGPQLGRRPTATAMRHWGRGFGWPPGTKVSAKATRKGLGSTQAVVPLGAGPFLRRLALELASWRSLGAPGGLLQCLPVPELVDPASLHSFGCRGPRGESLGAPLGRLGWGPVSRVAQLLARPRWARRPKGPGRGHLPRRSQGPSL